MSVRWSCVRHALILIISLVLLVLIIWHPSNQRKIMPQNGADKSDEMLSIYVITGPNTKDFPGQYTVRRQQVGRDSKIHIDKDPIGHAKTLEDARKLVPPGLTRFERHPSDDAVIVESWL